MKALDLRGRIVRLGAAVDAILTGHDYPTPVAKLLGEAIVLTAMLGSALKFEGRFILQTQKRRAGADAGGQFHLARHGAGVRPLRRRTGRRRHCRRRGGARANFSATAISP